MKTYQVDLPAMYGDHHVTEVRRIILELPGIEDLYASSAFQYLKVSYDEAQTSEADILAKLEAAGYTGEMPVPQETSTPANESNGDTLFRHTAAFEQTKLISFHQETVATGRALWPCPGMGPIKKVEE
jgi:copper chaperone CopZ